MISQNRLRVLARELGVRQGYAEKNYVNSWILWGIFTSGYGENLMFKGGTALSKLYFPQSWRFSEDLDFGVEGRYQGSEDDLRGVLDTVTERSGIDTHGHKYVKTSGTSMRLSAERAASRRSSSVSNRRFPSS